MSLNDKIRAFIAIELTDPATLDAIEKYQTALQKSAGPLKLVKRDIMHVTIRFLGDITEDTAKKIYIFLQSEINGCFFGTSTRDATVEGVDDFNRKAFFVHIKGQEALLNEIYEKISRFLEQKLKISPEKRGFTPHLTIARAKEDRTNHKSKNGNAGQIPYAQLKANYKSHVFGPWKMKEVLLKKSVLTPQGPIYSNLKF
jgi:2'-5' RNA ligase